MIFILQQIKPNINLLLHKQIADFRIQDFILIFWNIREVTGCQTDQVGPLVGQFWFIQCLLVYTLLAPIIWYATQKLRMIFVIALGAIALSGMIPEVPGFNDYYLYFFIFQNGYMPILCFLAISFCSVMCSVLVYWGMDRFFHKALLVLNGKRI